MDKDSAPGSLAVEANLRAATRAWLEATDRLDAAMRQDAETAVVMELADAATLARLRFHRALVESGWTPPRTANRPSV